MTVPFSCLKVCDCLIRCSLGPNPIRQMCSSCNHHGWRLQCTYEIAVAAPSFSCEMTMAGRQRVRGDNSRGLQHCAIPSSDRRQLKFPQPFQAVEERRRTMALIELRCTACGARFIIDGTCVDDDEETVLCPYCEQVVDVP